LSVAGSNVEIMRGIQVTTAEPRLGRFMVEQLIEPGVLLVGSIRRDGSPRISGVEPLIMDGDLWLSMTLQSMKAKDLRRAPRVVLNSVITDRAGEIEIKVQGRAREELDAERLRAYAGSTARELGWQPVVGEFALFQVDLATVTLIGYDPDTGEQHVAKWPQRQEYVRPTTTPTSLGPHRPVSRTF
jgi:hypothetical protein